MSAVCTYFKYGLPRYCHELATQETFGAILLGWQEGNARHERLESGWQADGSSALRKNRPQWNEAWWECSR
jgi:hypothetical protein